MVSYIYEIFLFPIKTLIPHIYLIWVDSIFVMFCFKLNFTFPIVSLKNNLHVLYIIKFYRINLHKCFKVIKNYDINLCRLK